MLPELAHMFQLRNSCEVNHIYIYIYIYIYINNLLRVGSVELEYMFKGR